MYRFLATPRWLGLGVLMIAAAGVMVGLGIWQLHRFQEREAVNDRITASSRMAPVPIASAPLEAWTRVTLTGRYDPAHEILARGRTVERRVGYEVLTPLRLADGSAVLVDRGWVPPAPSGARAQPTVPPAPTGTVTVVGRLHLSESHATPVESVDGVRQVRRINVGSIAPALPYPLYGAYVLADDQAGLEPIPVELERSWQNAAYVVQWWLLAGMALFGFGYLAYREAHGLLTPPVPAVQPTTPPLDRVRG